MSFSANVKNEIAASLLNEIENRNLLLGYLYVNGNISSKKVSLMIENMAVARKIFKTLKYSYKMNVQMTIRLQKKFKVKRIFIFEVNDEKNILQSELENLDFSDIESMQSFIKGVFLATGSISDPKKSGYHMEMLFDEIEQANLIIDILAKLN